EEAMRRFLAGVLAGALATGAVFLATGAWRPFAASDPERAAGQPAPVTAPGAERDSAPTPSPGAEGAPPAPQPPSPAPLGRFRFEHAMPESVVARSHPDVQAVAAANELRWFDDEAAYERAEASWSRVLAYAARLEADPAFRC